MLCLDKQLKSEKTEKSSGRDRSKSVCVSNFERNSKKNQGAFRRRSSSFSSAVRKRLFSRKYSGCIEVVHRNDIDSEEHIRRYRIENGASGSQEESDQVFLPTTAQNLDRWYFKYFLGKMHQNFVGEDSGKNPFLFSVTLTDYCPSTCTPLCRAILFEKTGALKTSFLVSQKRNLTVQEILAHFHNNRIDKNPKEIFSPDIQKDLLMLEEQEIFVKFKFGIIYMKHGQCTDDEIFNNECGSSSFDQFLKLLGNKINLKGWDKYNGGLDVERNMTGKHAFYTTYKDNEIMFHVSTLLPYSVNGQQVDRKRHIANDIVNIIFIDIDDVSQSEAAHAAFNPNWIKSKLTNIFAVVSVDRYNQYRLSICSNESVSFFGPSLPSPPLFYNPSLFRNFLLLKLINGEKAALKTPVFAKKREQIMDWMIKELYKKHADDTSSTFQPIEFVSIGKAIKFEAIFTDLDFGKTLFKKHSWETSCFCPVLPEFTIFCGDSWSENKLVLGTDEGVFVVKSSTFHRHVFDNSLQAQQLNVVEAYDVLLMRVDQAGKEAKLYALRLSQIEALTKPLCREDIKDQHLKKAKGLYLYAVTKAGVRLTVSVALNKKLMMYQWKHEAACAAGCSKELNIADEFYLLWELVLKETPSMLSILDQKTQSSNDILICVGYNNHWDIVNSQTGKVQNLYRINCLNANLINAFNLDENQTGQVLLCYDDICHYQTMNDKESPTELDFSWNVPPKNIVYAFPYLIGFTADCIEIRFAINGNLMHLMWMPQLQLIASKNDIFFATTAPNKIEQMSNWQDFRRLSLQSPAKRTELPSVLQSLCIFRLPMSDPTRVNQDCVSTRSTPSSPSKLSNTQGKVSQSRVSRRSSESPIL